jgi:putative membrane protein
MEFTDLDKENIKKAVGTFEAQTAGELVPYFVKQSGLYREASWFGALLFGFSVIIGATLMHFLDSEMQVITIVSLFFCCSLVGWFLPIVFPFSIRGILSGRYLGKKVFLRALEAFVDEEVFSTDDRIGILIFVSETERQVVVLADKEINKVVEQQTWNEVVDVIVQGVKSKKLGDGLVKAIGVCEKILLDHGFENRIKPENEISNELREG